ncbi:lipoprotein [Caballeronia sordidicola]|uniref:Lipoprotein n=1 Tax=Caballeronia sordidicola TaxID=196367 RepID=A0A158G932_CABSO|nr:DUF3443 domain-containing protein [Caballeronia sordidicola]SAL28387.1 lipoprotein [Caballeronia sordidicola]
MRNHPSCLLFLTLIGACALLTACGGGGGGDATSAAVPATASAAPAASAPSAVTPASAAEPASSPPSNTVAQSTTPNVLPITVGRIATGTRNMLQASVTICVPGTATCQTIDNIQVDTGSQGLRILASVLAPAMTLPAVTGTGGATIASCTVFGSGYTWGSVRTADVRLAGEVAASTAIQVIADPAIPTVPADCSNSGLPMLTATTLRSNGILGVGPFAADCGSGCATTALSRWYYSCASGTCASATQPVAQQVTNPVSNFASDNNGILIELPAIADTGASSVSGTMTFGIGSQSNNQLGNAQVLTSNRSTGFVSTSFQGSTYGMSFIDSGSNGLFFPMSSVPGCGLWFCPTTLQSLVASISGTNGTTSSVTFAVGNASSLFASNNNAFNNLAGPANGYFDWGLPFFYGRRVFTAIEAQVTPAGNGPYYAF